MTSSNEDVIGLDMACQHDKAALPESVRCRASYKIIGLYV